MVEIELEGDAIVIRMQGLHRFWSLKSSLRIPVEHIVEVRHDPERARGPHGLRFPGTHVPFLYFAGTAYQSDMRPDFWTVRDPEKAIVIQCSADAAYDEVIVEVENPEASLALIKSALATRRAP